ncbi:hypothetical protein HY251_01615 [bacterium]|nr:hypothetical protein [bacterium]
MSARALALAFLLVIAGAVPARAGDHPQVWKPGSDADPDWSEDKKHADEDGPDYRYAPHQNGLWIGSKSGETFAASAYLFLAGWKKRSHFGFKEHGGRSGEVAFGKDLGAPSLVPIPGLSMQLDLSRAGFLGGDVSGFSQYGMSGRVEQQKSTNGLTLQPGDLVHSYCSFLFGRVFYGYELRYRLHLPHDVSSDFPIELAGALTYGATIVDVDVRLRRVTPNPSPQAGGHILTWYLSPGLRVSIDFLDMFGIGVDYGIPGVISPTLERVTLTDRVRVFGGAHFGWFEATVGWRLVAMHVNGGGRGLDTRFTGIDFSLGVRF